MAGERLAKITIQASLSADDTERGNQTLHLRVRLAGVWHDYYRGVRTQQHQNYFAVPDPDDVGRDYVKQAVENLLVPLRLEIQSLGLPYTVSATRDLGDTIGTNPPLPKIAFDIEATQYDNQLNLDFYNYLIDPPTGWAVTQNLTTLQPIRVVQQVVAAGIYGSATGSIYLSAFEGNQVPYTYAWADDVTQTGRIRQNLRAGTYTCVVGDQDGVTTTVTCVVTSDAQLLVTVQQTEDSLTLVVSGGVPPYAVAWDDGPTDLVRQQLSAGTYEATVTDAHGASQRVTATLLANRCYFSQNPVRLALDAGAAYRADPTTKPNLSFVAQVWVEQAYLSGVYEQVGPTLEQPADAAGRTVFDVQALLNACVSEHLPEPDAALLTPAVNLFKRFYLKSAEKYGTPPVAAGLSQAQVHTVLCGGLSEEVFAAGTWPAYQTDVLPFLTWEPDYQRVALDQPVYLYYQHAAAPGDVQVWARVHHVDNTVSAARKLGEFPDLRRWEVYCLNVSPAALHFTGYEVVSYEVWLTTPAGVLLSEVRHLVLERAYYPQARYVLYCNSLGGVNSLAAPAAAKRTLAVAASEAQRPAYDPALGDVATLERVGTPTVSLATGPRRRAQVEADQDLLLSRRAVLVRGGQRWPGRVLAATFTVRDEEAGLASLSFDFVLARQRRFSPRLPAVVAGQTTAPVRGGEGATP